MLPRSAAAQNGQPHTVLVAMRDSTTLPTDLYLPAADTTLATILIRTVAPRNTQQDLAQFFMHHGYNVAVQSIRGLTEETRNDTLFLADGWAWRRDGFDTVEWIAAQPWSDGQIGAYGTGIDGFLLHLLAVTESPHLKTLYIVGAPYNFYAHVLFEQGAFRQNLTLALLDSIGRPDEMALYEKHPSYEEFWYPFNPFREAKSIDIPISYVGGWHDAFYEGAIAAFQAVQKYGQKFARHYQRLLVGPWSQHGGGLGKIHQGEATYPPNAVYDIRADALRWFDQWLRARDTGFIYSAPAQFYVMGAYGEVDAPGNVWRAAAVFPPKHELQSYYLQQDSVLSPSKPVKDEEFRRFVYNPANPVPTLGGANLFMEAGPFDQRYLEHRSDVLLFTTAPLETPLTVIGPIRLELDIASSQEDTDFTAKLTDVYPDGRSILVVDGITRARYRESTVNEKLLRPEKIESLSIFLGNTAMVFNRGHRLRLAISSSNSPRFQPNPNTAAAFRQHVQESLATNTVYFGRKRPSRLILPVISVNEEQ